MTAVEQVIVGSAVLTPVLAAWLVVDLVWARREAARPYDWDRDAWARLVRPYDWDRDGL